MNPLPDSSCGCYNYPWGRRLRPRRTNTSCHRSTRSSCLKATAQSSRSTRSAPLSSASSFQTSMPHCACRIPFQWVNDNSTSTLRSPKGIDFLSALIKAIEGFYHPSNTGSWTGRLAAFMNCLVGGMAPCFLLWRLVWLLFVCEKPLSITRIPTRANPPFKSILVGYTRRKMPRASRLNMRGLPTMRRGSSCRSSSPSS